VPPCSSQLNAPQRVSSQRQSCLDLQTFASRSLLLPRCRSLDAKRAQPLGLASRSKRGQGFRATPGPPHRAGAPQLYE
jgi:hypothetical protein